MLSDHTLFAAQIVPIVVVVEVRQCRDHLYCSVFFLFHTHVIGEQSWASRYLSSTQVDKFFRLWCLPKNLINRDVFYDWVGFLFFLFLTVSMDAII